MTQGGAPHPARVAANFSGWDQKFLAGQLLPPFISSFPFGSEEAISRHFQPSPATSPSPLIHKGARRRLPGHVGGAPDFPLRPRPASDPTPGGPAPRDPVTRHPATRHPATQHPGGRPSGPTPTQHERSHPLAHGADGVRQRRQRPRPPAPRLGDQDRPADRLAFLRGPQQPHHDVERPARAPRGPQGEQGPRRTLASGSPSTFPPTPHRRPVWGQGRAGAAGLGPAAGTRGARCPPAAAGASEVSEGRLECTDPQKDSSSQGGRPAAPPTSPLSRPALGRRLGQFGELPKRTALPGPCLVSGGRAGSGTRAVAPGPVHRLHSRGPGPGDDGWPACSAPRPGPGPATVSTRLPGLRSSFLSADRALADARGPLASFCGGPLGSLRNFTSSSS